MNRERSILRADFVRRATKSQLAHSVAYLAPMALMVLAHRFGLRGPAVIFRGDPAPGIFGLGLTWVTGTPNALYHVPAIASQQLSAVIILAMGLPTESLSRFYEIGLAVQWAIALAAAWWVAGIAVRRAMSLVVTALLGAVVASMPTIAEYHLFWSFYFPMGVLLVPVVLEISLNLTSERPDYLRQFASLVALGFLGANYYIALVLVVAVVIATVVAFPTVAELRERLSAPRGPTALYTSLQSMLIVLAGLSLYGALLRHETDRSLASLMFVTVAASFVVYWLLTRNRAIQSITNGLVLPLLAGWALGANVLIPTWTRAALYAAKYKGGAAPGYSPGEVVEHLNLWQFLVGQAWHVFILLALVVAVVLTRRKSFADRSTRFVPVLIFVAIGLNAVVTSDLVLVGGTVDAAHFGQTTRYFLPSLGVVAVALVWLAGTTPSRIRSWTLALFAFACCTSGFDYLDSASTAIGERRNKTTIDTLVARHLASNPRNVVYCARTIEPDGCELLYGYNNYRSYESRARTNLTSTAHGRMRYAASPSSAVTDGHRAGVDALVISDNADEVPPQLRPLWADKYATVSRLIKTR